MQAVPQQIIVPPHKAYFLQKGNRHIVKAEMCKRSFAFFVREFWQEIDTEPLVWNWHLDVFCHELEQVYRRVFDRKPKEYDLLINVPPGTSKSKIFTVFGPVWGWLNDPTLKFINGSYSMDVSLEHADISRDLVKCKRFQVYFPEIQIRPDKDSKGSYHNTNRGSRFATSVGGTVTGMHGHVLTVDDPLNPKKAASEAELNNANHWVEQTLSTRKINKEVTATIIVMQRLHELDTSGKLLEKMKAGKKKVRHICLPGEIWDEQDVERVQPPCLRLQYVDGLLDTKRMNKAVLLDLLADLGQYGYAGQIGQNPHPPGGGMFKIEKFEVITGIPDYNILEVVRYWDKAGTDKKDNPGACYTAGVKIALLRDSRWTYAILDVVRGQWEAHERETHIRQVAQMDGPHVDIWIEQEPGSGGKESAENTIRNLHGFTVYAERPTGDKVFRADPYSVQVNWGNIVLIKGDWNYEFLKEHESFPNGKRKDQVDAAAGGFNKLAGMKRAGTWGR